MWSNSLLPLFPGSLCPGAVKRVVVSTMNQIDLFNHSLWIIIIIIDCLKAHSFIQINIT